MSGFRTLPSSGAIGVVSAGRGAGVARSSSWGPRRASLLVSGVALALFGLSLAVSFVVTPEDIESRRVVLSPTCHLKMLLGHECPTCGMTRAFTALSHGRFDDARRYNGASPVVYAAWWASAAAALAAFLRALFARNESRKIPA